MLKFFISTRENVYFRADDWQGSGTEAVLKYYNRLKNVSQSIQYHERARPTASELRQEVAKKVEVIYAEAKPRLGSFVALFDAILTHISEGEDSKSQEMKIFLSVLQPQDLLLMFYIGMSDEICLGFKSRAEELTLFRNIDFKDLAHSDHKDVYEPFAYF